MEVEREEELGRVYDSRLLRFVWGYVRPYRSLFFLSMLLMQLNIIFALVQPYIFKLTIDLFLTGRRISPPRWLMPMLTAAGGHGLPLMGALYLGLLLGEVATFYGQFYLTMKVAQLSLSDLRF